MIIENKYLKPLVEMSDAEIVAIIRNAHLAEVCVNRGKEWRPAIGGRPMTPYGIYRLIPNYTPITVDWSVLDDSIQWIAADEDGDIFGYCEEPCDGNYTWNCDGYSVLISGIIKSLNRGDIPWNQSLIKRPKGV